MQSRTPVNRFSKPPGPSMVKSYAWSSWSGTVTVRDSPAAMLYSMPSSSKVNGASPSLAAVMSTPPLSQFSAADRAGIAPVSAQVALAVAETVDSLE